MCGIGVALYHRPVAAPTRRSGIPAAVLQRRGPDAQASVVVGDLQTAGFELHLTAAVLHMRGASCQPQPLQSDAGDALLWNGEIFGGGVDVAEGESDTQRLLAALQAAGDEVPELMSSIHGPWAFAYWHAASRTLWYGRDGLGRRSLLRSESQGGSGCSALFLCSVATPLHALLPCRSCACCWGPTSPSRTRACSSTARPRCTGP